MSDHVLDAKGKSLGRLASEATVILRGKHQAAFERNVAPKHKVTIINAKFVRLSGNKMQQEARERYSGYPGGLKKIRYEVTFKKDPRELVRQAISGMIPRNRLKKGIMKNLTVYVGQK